jgi:hypothetical protein
MRVELIESRSESKMFIICHSRSNKGDWKSGEDDDDDVSIRSADRSGRTAQEERERERERELGEKEVLSGEALSSNWLKACDFESKRANEMQSFANVSSISFNVRLRLKSTSSRFFRST